MPTRPATLETARLQLITLEPEELRALIAEDAARAAERTGVTFPAGWFVDVGRREGLPWHLRHLEAHETHRAWRVRVVVERAAQLAIGGITLKGPPNAEGDVEIGWGIDLAYRQQGYAVEAANGVATWAATHRDFRSLSATIANHNVASQRVALRLGMVRTSEHRREEPLWLRRANP